MSVFPFACFSNECKWSYIHFLSEGEDIEDICFFEVNTKYISSSELKTSEFSRVRSTSENYYVFNSRDEIYLVFTEKKANFLFILYNAQAFSNAQGT